jgi:hypothetical protein
MVKSKSKEEVAQEISDKVLSIAAQLHGIYEPQWNARADVLKTIVSLSSASIVLSVTFSSSLHALKLGSSWRYLIVISFALFVTSLIIALIALWTGTRVYELQSNFFEMRRKVGEAFMSAPSQDEFLERLDKIQKPINISLGKSDTRTSRLFHISSVCFCLAVLCLAIVGAKQLLSF